VLNWNQLILGDCFDIMPQLEKNSVDLIFTSVPDLNDLGIDDIIEYQNFISDAMDEFHNLISDKGMVAMCQTDRKIGGKVLSKHSYIINYMQELGFVLKDYKIMVVNTMDSRDQYKFPYQHLCVFTRKGTIQRKGDWLLHFLRYDMKKPSNRPFYIWNENFVRLVIENLSNEGDKVFDPFSGSGIVLYVAKQMNREYLGCELNKEVYDASMLHTALV
jgi:DNA modification methylase